MRQHSGTHGVHPFPLSPSPPPELLPKGSKEEQRDYVFYLAVGNYRLKVRPQSSSRPTRRAPALSKPAEGSGLG